MNCKMEDMTIVQQGEAYVAKAEVVAVDRRTNVRSVVTIYCKLNGEDQDVKPIVMKALEAMGYSYYGTNSVDTTSYPMDSEKFYKAGKALERESANRE